MQHASMHAKMVVVTVVGTVVQIHIIQQEHPLYCNRDCNCNSVIGWAFVWHKNIRNHGATEKEIKAHQSITSPNAHSATPKSHPHIGKTPRIL